ncbi:hypothetical protein BDR22DRAFT_795639, partial [Usnea florida]
SPQRSTPTELSISPITASTLPAYRRLITLLLPIRYQDKFYKDSVIGGIQCRLEAIPSPPRSNPINPQPSYQQPHDLYIQTLAILAPYRHLGIATALLDAIICTALTHYPRENINVKGIYAHVWEANEEALEWYKKRGFEIGEELVEGYYRKLRPSGAKIVRKRV